MFLSQIAQQWETVEKQQRIFEILTGATRQLVTASRHTGSIAQLQSPRYVGLEATQPSQSQGDKATISLLEIPDFDLDVELDSIDFDSLDWEKILAIPRDVSGPYTIDTEEMDI